MRFRTGLMIGFAAGYVLGAKAGTERYEQIRKLANAVAEVPPIRRVIDDSKELADDATTAARQTMSEKLHEAGDAVKELVDEKLSDSGNGPPRGS